MVLLKSANDAVLIHFNDVHFGKNGTFVLGGRIQGHALRSMEIKKKKNRSAYCVVMGLPENMLRLHHILLK